MPIGTGDGTTYEDESGFILGHYHGLDTAVPNEEEPKEAPVKITVTPRTEFDTKLDDTEESAYTDWKSKYAPNDQGIDYDLRGAFKAGITPEPERGHFPDTFKKPNHPTFSTESQYNGGNFQGGTWGTDAEGKDTFTPGKTNLDNFGPQGLQDYFKKNEPNVKLILPSAGQLAPGTPVIQTNTPNREDYTYTPPTNTDEILGLGKKIFEELRPDYTREPTTKNITPGFTGKVPSTQIDPKMATLGAAMDLIQPMIPKAAVFAGIAAKSLDRLGLSKAQFLEKQGKTAQSIWEETGFFRGADNRWRFEIEDKNAKIDYEGFKKVDPGIDDEHSGMYLDRLLNHPRLFEAYPELKGIGVNKLPPDSIIRGQFSTAGKIYLNPNLSPEQLKSTLLHEIQHAIQHMERFSSGSSPGLVKKAMVSPRMQDMTSEFEDKRDEILNILKTEFSPSDIGSMLKAVNFEPVLNKPWGSGWSTTMDKYEYAILKQDLETIKKNGIYPAIKYIVDGEDILQRVENYSYDLYRRTKGEVESRNVQQRLTTNRGVSPIRTEEIDTPRPNQIDPIQSSTQ